MKRANIFLFSLLTTLLLSSCKKENPNPSIKEVTGPNPNIDNSVTPCGTPEEHVLWAGQNINSGTVTVYNDVNNLYVTYTTINGWMIEQTHLFVGSCNSIPTNGGGNPIIGQFPYSEDHSPMVSSYTYTIPLSQLDDCFCVAAHASLKKMGSNGGVIQSETGWASGSPFGGASWAMKFEYCEQLCSEEPCVIEAGDYKTFTIGGWGASPSGNNPGTYLHANFDAAFPTGLIVGCPTGNTLTLTSAQAVTDLMPSTGTSGALTQSLVDPIAINNTFGSQLIGVMLALGFDAYDANFSVSGSQMADLIISSGTFAGWTVQELVDEANRAFGGCGSTYSFAQLNTALTAINENFDNGTINNGYLSCP